MAKKSEFEYLEGHKDKLITKVSFRNGDTSISWIVMATNEDDEGNVKERVTDKGAITCHEPSEDELDNAMSELRRYVKKYLIGQGGSKLESRWNEKLHVRDVAFKYNQHCTTAKILATLTGADGQHAILQLPHTPLYDKETEGHANGQIETYGEELTKCLETIQTEAKKYLGGKRGAMQSKLDYTEETTEEAA